MAHFFFIPLTGRLEWNYQEPETAFLLNIYALNAKGRSQPITLETTTLRAAQKHTGIYTHKYVFKHQYACDEGS